MSGQRNQYFIIEKAQASLRFYFIVRLRGKFYQIVNNIVIYWYGFGGCLSGCLWLPHVGATPNIWRLVRWCLSLIASQYHSLLIVCSQQEQDASLTDGNSHVANIGRLVEVSSHRTHLNPTLASSRFGLYILDGCVQRANYTYYIISQIWRESWITKCWTMGVKTWICLGWLIAWSHEFDSCPSTFRLRAH